MRFVERADIRPSRCAVFPQIAGNHPQGFFDCGELPGFDNRVYVSIVAVEEMARKRGWCSPDEQAELAAERNALEERLQQLEAELMEADKFQHAVDVLESRDFRARKKPGRPKKETV